MTLADNLIKGLVIGFCVAAPVGPIGLLCIRNSVTAGFRRGLATGLGAATADTLCGLIAACGLTVVTELLVDHRVAIQTAGGVFLVGLGIHLLRARPNLSAEPAVTKGAHLSAYASTFLLTLANPLTILSFIGIFAGIGVSNQRPDPGAAALVVVGVFLGSVSWWLLLSTTASWLGGKLHPARLRLLNVLAGAAIAGFGVWQLMALLK